MQVICKICGNPVEYELDRLNKTIKVYHCPKCAYGLNKVKTQDEIEAENELKAIIKFREDKEKRDKEMRKKIEELEEKEWKEQIAKRFNNIINKILEVKQDV